jgi:hypothetical protein
MGKIRGTGSGKGTDFKKILAFSPHRGRPHPDLIGYFCPIIKSSVE